MVTNDEVECSDDTISRQAAIATALEFFVEFLGGGFYENSQKELIARFQRLPSSQSCEYWDAESGYCALHRPSAQPEKTDCEYCHEDSDGYVRPIEKNSHAWLVRRGRTMKLRVRFKGEYRECDILFCPMCGRRLTNYE